MKLSMMRTFAACVCSLTMLASSALAGTMFTADVTVRPTGPNNILVSANPSKTAQWLGHNGGNTAMRRVVNTPNRATWTCQVINANTGSIGFEHIDMYNQSWTAGYYSVSSTTSGTRYYQVNRLFLGIRFYDEATSSVAILSAAYFGPAGRTSSNGLTQCLGTNDFWYSPVLTNVADPSDYSFYTNLNGEWTEINYGFYNLYQVIGNFTFTFNSSAPAARSMGANGSSASAASKFKIKGTPKKLTESEIRELTKMVDITDQVNNADTNGAESTLNKESSEDDNKKPNLRKDDKNKKSDHGAQKRNSRTERRNQRNRK